MTVFLIAAVWAVTFVALSVSGAPSWTALAALISGLLAYRSRPRRKDPYA